MVGLAVPCTLSVITYGLSRNYLVEQRQRSAARQVRANAQLVRAVLRSPSPDVPRLLSAVETSSSASLVRYGGQWFASSAGFGPDVLPAVLRSTVIDDGHAARQRHGVQGRTMLLVGIPLGDDDAYFEVFALTELRRTLSTIGQVLVAGTAVTFVISAAGGVWAARRVVRPVREIGQTAAAIASGHLDARLDVGNDEELLALATAFNAMVDSLQARIDRDARFASDVSHELRSPLTTLRSAVEVVLARVDDLEPRSARSVQLLAEEVDRFEVLVQDLLEISRFDAGVATLSVEPVDVHALVEQTLRAEGRPIHVGGSGVTVLADRRRLQQAVRNIVRNAEAHASGVEVASVDVVGDVARIVIEDRGEGIASDDRDTIFTRFGRGRRAGRRGGGDGVGLGLALASEHVQLHGGRLWVEDAVPHGARFVIEVPACDH